MPYYSDGFSSSLGTFSSQVSYDNSYFNQTNYGAPTKKELKQLAQDAKKRAEARKQYVKKWNLSMLDYDDKKDLMQTVKKLLSEGRWEEVHNGFKWVLFFLGVAILLNFKTILDIIEKVATK